MTIMRSSRADLIDHIENNKKNNMYNVQVVRDEERRNFELRHFEISLHTCQSLLDFRELGTQLPFQATRLELECIRTRLIEQARRIDSRNTDLEELINDRYQYDIKQFEREQAKRDLYRRDSSKRWSVEEREKQRTLYHSIFKEKTTLSRVYDQHMQKNPDLV